jgi:hypothetical protein
MNRRRRPSLPASIAALLRRVLRLPAADGATSRRAGRKPLTVIGQLPGTRRLDAANDSEGG